MSYETEALDAGLKAVYRAIEKPGKSLHQKDKDDDQRENIQAYIDGKMEMVITETCKELDWDPALDYNRKDVKDMILRALRGGR